MGPKTFVECYVCFKKFGSKSILFHEPKCLEKWRISNRNQPAEKRASTPVKPSNWKYSQISFWICSHCQLSVPLAKKNQHLSSCLTARKLQLNNYFRLKNKMTGVVKADFSPRRGKENKNISNNIPTLSVLNKNAKNEARVPPKDPTIAAQNGDDIIQPKENVSQMKKVNETVKSDDTDKSTSKRSLRPQTKILRRPTPNLNHPVIHVDSDDSSGDSSCSDKAKEENPKRIKMGESAESTHKTKNFIMYNKYNVEKNTKNTPKERTPTAIASLIPNPCNSCNRSQQPERLHSHVKKDSRGLMNRRSPSTDVKMASPQKKPLENIDKVKLKIKESKIPTTTGIGCDTNKISDGKEFQSERKESLKKVSSESCLVAAISVSEKSDKDILEPFKACYICQEQVKISSLLLHESQCLETWKKTNNSLTPNLRKLPPRRPDDEELPSPSEDDPGWSSVQSQLVPCPVCSRTFFPERLPIHRRVCKGKASPRPLKRASSMREQSASSRNGEDQKPAAVYVPCYVCSRNFGSWVISMHEQQCLRKWRRENDKLPDEEQQDEPQKIPGSSSDDDITSLIELGNTAWESHLQQLVPCPLCSRTFFPNRLAVHKRSCKGISSSTRPRSNKAT